MAKFKYKFKRRYFIVVLFLLLFSVFNIELNTFADVLFHSDQSNLNNKNNEEQLDPLTIIDPTQSLSNLNVPHHLHQNINQKDWFRADKWLESDCPYYEDICIYNQKMRVFNKSNEFYLSNQHPQHVFGDHMPHMKESYPIYRNALDATYWDINADEYIGAQCSYSSSIINHIIVQGYFQTMLGEWYARVLVEFYRLFYENNGKYVINRDIKLYMFIGEQVPLYTSHHLFMQPFTNYNLDHFSSLIQRIDCNCYKRIFFCGFRKHWNSTINKHYLTARTRMIDQNFYIGDKHIVPDIYPKMIEFYNNWMNEKDVNIYRDTLLWKFNRLKEYFQNKIITIEYSNVSSWFFIGFYQRHYRRTWLKLEKEILPECNKKYNKYKIFCCSINLEGYLHPRDVVVMHRSFDMLIGIHGAHLTDSIWMYDPKSVAINDKINDNKYIIELLPTNGPSWTSSVKTPTALGILFYKSKFNHIGFKLSPDSITDWDWERGPSRWYLSDFTVKWYKLTDIIDFLIIDDGGYCNKYNNNPKEIKVPISFKQKNYTFAIYNAFCNRTGDGVPWSFVQTRRTDKMGGCHDCSELKYETT